MWVQRCEPRKKPDELLAVNIGLVLPQTRTAGAVCVIETVKRFEIDKSFKVHFTVRNLETLTPGRSTPDIGNRLNEIVRRIRALDRIPRILADITGRGEPPVKYLRGVVAGIGWIKGVTFNYGSDFTEEGYGDEARIRCGKALLVSLLKILLEAGQLHLPRVPEARQLANDLKDYELRTDEADGRLEGAFRVGQRDELVTGLGLALLDEGLPSYQWSSTPAAYC